MEQSGPDKTIGDYESDVYIKCGAEQPIKWKVKVFISVSWICRVATGTEIDNIDNLMNFSFSKVWELFNFKSR